MNWQNTEAGDAQGNMGKTTGVNNAEFPVGTTVKIANRKFLEDFLEAGQYHNELEPEQLDYADRKTTVAKVEFFTGGDEIYTLEGIPGVWHEECLSHA